MTPLYVPTLPSAMVEWFDAAAPPLAAAAPGLVAVRAPDVLAAAAPVPAEPDLLVGPLASAVGEHWLLVVVVEEALDPPPALVVVVVDFEEAPDGLVVVAVVEAAQPALLAPRA